MSSPQNAWISLAIVAPFATVCVLRLRFPAASRRAEIDALPSPRSSFSASTSGWQGPDSRGAGHADVGGPGGFRHQHPLTGCRVSMPPVMRGEPLCRPVRRSQPLPPPCPAESARFRRPEPPPAPSAKILGWPRLVSIAGRCSIRSGRAGFRGCSPERRRGLTPPPLKPLPGRGSGTATPTFTPSPAIRPSSAWKCWSAAPTVWASSA